MAVDNRQLRFSAMNTGPPVGHNTHRSRLAKTGRADTHKEVQTVERFSITRTRNRTRKQAPSPYTGSELPQESRVVLGQQTNVTDALLAHRHPL